MLYPQKNLIKPFADSDWFSDGNPTWNIDTVNPYRMQLNVPVSANGRLIHIPVELGKSYTFSFKYCEGLYRLYKRKVLVHDTNLVIANHTDVGKPDTFTFTVDSSFQGFVTLRLTHSLAGSYIFENLQLEEGLAKTNFSTYKLGNKRPALPRETINSDMSGASSHVYPYGNVIQVKEDVRLWGYKIQVGTPTGTFDSVIYEWDNGAIGQPLFREVINANAAGVMNLSYGGTLLKAGKKYYIGRNDPNRDNSSSGNAGVFRKTAMPPADFKYISTLGGTQFYSPNIDFPSTWYYIFALEIESRKNKPAAMVPKKNLFNVNGGTIVNKSGTTTGRHYSAYAVDNPNRALYYWQTPVEGGKQYVMSWAKAGYSVALWELNEAGIVTADTGWKNTSMPITLQSTTKYVMFVVRKLPDPSATLASDILDLGLQFEAGSVPTPLDAYTLINKPAVLYPESNLLDVSDGDWINGSADGNWTHFVDSSRIRKNKRVRVKPNTKYTLKVAAGYQIYIRQFGSESSFEIGSSTWRDDGYTFTTDAATNFVGVILRRVDNAALPFSEFPNIKPMIAEGEQWQYKPYKLLNKKAVLYPHPLKNLIPPLTDSKWFVKSGHSKGLIVNDYEYKMSIGFVGVVGYDVPITLKPNTTYTLGATLIGTGARLRLMRASDDSFLVNLNPSAPVQTYTTAALTDYKIRIENNGQSGDYTTKEFFIYEGNITNPVFEPMKFINKL